MSSLKNMDGLLLEEVLQLVPLEDGLWVEDTVLFHLHSALVLYLHFSRT